MKSHCTIPVPLLPFAMLKTTLTTLTGAAFAACILAACSPEFDWRDYRSGDAPYTILLPGKPSTFTRDIDLNGLKISMTMTATQVDQATFAVGTALLPDASKAPAALQAMKTALLNNIGAKVESEHASSAASSSAGKHSESGEVDVRGMGLQNGKPVELAGRFVSRDKRIYQVIVLAPTKRVSQDNIDTFMSSFKIN